MIPVDHKTNTVKALLRSKRLSFLAVIAWATVIFCLSGIPRLHSGLPQDFILRKLAHVLEFFILASLLYKAFKNTLDWKQGPLFLFIGGLCVLYALMDELHQFFVAGRRSALSDVMIDLFGFFYFLACFAPSRFKRAVLGCAVCFILICPSTAISQEVFFLSASTNPTETMFQNRIPTQMATSANSTFKKNISGRRS